jgi:predicted Zn-dependent protease
MARSRGRIRWLPIAVFVAYAGWYALTHREEVPVTGRTQLVDLSPADEARLGASAYRAALAKAEVLGSGPEVELVRRVAARIAAVSDDPGFDWEVNVLRSAQANAFALPGGKVAVYTGILPITRDEDGLAVVVGHEIAHAIARHGAERMAQQKLAQAGQLTAALAVGEMERETRYAVMAAFGLGAQYGVLLPFSRKHESEADRIGLLYMARACFDPRAAPEVWRRMAKASGGGSPREFTSTHPSHETRIRDFESWMPEALAERERHCRTRDPSRAPRRE